MKKVMLLFTAIAVFSGCSKDDDNGLSNDECKVVSINSDDFGERTTFEYDAQGRIVKISMVAEGYSDLHELTYQPNSISVKHYYNGNLYGQYEYTLDGAGLITSNTQSYTYSYYSYTYSDGYLTGMDLNNGYPYSSTTKMEYSNGNLIKTSYTEGVSGSHPHTYESNFSYDASQPYRSFTSIIIWPFGESFFRHGHGYALYETGFFGKLPKNRVTSVTYGHGDMHIDYETGSDGKVNRIKTTWNGQPDYDGEVGWKCD